MKESWSGLKNIGWKIEWEKLEETRCSLVFNVRSPRLVLELQGDKESIMTRKAAVNRMIHWQTAAIGRKVSPDSLVRYDGSRTLPAQPFRGRNDRIITAKLWKPLCRFNGKSTGIRYVNLLAFAKFSYFSIYRSIQKEMGKE